MTAGRLFEQLWTSLETFKSCTVERPANINQQPPDKQKKRVRIIASVSNATEKIGFLHACLVKLDDQCFIIAGTSGSGKSTLANSLIEELGGFIIANDWIAVEKSNNKLYASDLNNKEKIVHPRTPVDGMIILESEDRGHRSAYLPTGDELDKKLIEIFDDTTDDEAKILQQFWVNNAYTLPLLCVIPRYSLGIDQVASIAKDIICNRLNVQLKSKIRVGIIGLGSVGSTLAYRLSLSKYVREIHLLDHAPDTAKGVCLDLCHAQSNNSKLKIDCLGPEELFRSSDVIFFCFRDNTKPETFNIKGSGTERWNKFEPHMAIIKEYTKMIAKTQYSGSIMMVSNPVDALTYGLYVASQATEWPLKTYQLYGNGMELDQKRAEYYSKKLDNINSSIDVYGAHSTKIVVSAKMGKINSDDIKELELRIAEGSQAVRNYVSRTIYGPVESVVSSFESLVGNGDTHLTVIQDEAYLGGPVSIRSMLPSRIISSVSVDNQMSEIIRKDVGDVEIILEKLYN